MPAHSKRYRAGLESIDRSKLYGLAEAVSLLKDCPGAKFDESVDIALNLGVDPKHADQMVRGAIVLPHGIGKDTRVLVFAKGGMEAAAKAAGADFVGGEDLAKKITDEGWLDFERVIATPDMMSVVGRLGKVLGPRLMPNPSRHGHHGRGQGGEGDEAGEGGVPRGQERHHPRPHREEVLRSGKAHRQRQRHHRRGDEGEAGGCQGDLSQEDRHLTTMGPGIRIDPSSVQKAA
jgi:hypothetical protein